MDVKQEPTNRPHVASRRDGNDACVVELAGEWKGARELPGIESLRAELACGKFKTLRFDTAALHGWDDRLLILLLRVLEACEAHRVEVRKNSLPQGTERLVALARAVPARKDAEARIIQRSWLYRLGETGIGKASAGLAALAFIGEGAEAHLRLIRRKALMQWGDVLPIMQECGPKALGVVGLINFLIGMILGFVGAVQLQQFGASIYVADLVGIATVRELGCIMTGIIMCGRTGAAFAAQLGTMRVNQEIDAFKTFSISPMEYLVLPRVIALVLMMPLLCVFADVISIFGGFVVAVSMLDLTAVAYVERTIQAISLTNFFIGISKGAVFGLLVALAGCLRGMQCGQNAEAVGAATTSAVVTGIIWIITTDAIFAVVCQAIGI